MSSDRIDRTIERGPRHWFHLARRFFGSLSRAEPPSADTAWALRWLLPGEAALWSSMAVEDRRHTIRVARAYVAGQVDAPRAQVAAALLHDVGKVRSGLGTIGRVLAKLVGPRTRRFRLYHEHEPIGAQMLREVGSDPLTIAMIDGSCEQIELLVALLAADNA